eukprot:5894491-Prymnesium_polylepis.1
MVASSGAGAVAGASRSGKTALGCVGSSSIWTSAVRIVRGRAWSCVAMRGWEWSALPKKFTFRTVCFPSYQAGDSGQ